MEMNSSYYYSDEHLREFDSSLSENGNEVILASNNPKKRAGRKKFQETRHPVYRGVRQRNSEKWVCEVREPITQTRIWLGTYPTAEMAARAHDVAAIAFKGRSACLNFADSAWRLPVPASVDAKDIQKAAAEAAASFRPTESGEYQKEETTSVAESLVESPENAFYNYMDEEEAFYGMHELVGNMAEGLMMPPPQFNNDYVEMDTDVSFSLWSY